MQPRTDLDVWLHRIDSGEARIHSGTPCNLETAQRLSVYEFWADWNLHVISKQFRWRCLTDYRPSAASSGVGTDVTTWQHRATWRRRNFWSFRPRLDRATKNVPPIRVTCWPLDEIPLFMAAKLWNSFTGHRGPFWLRAKKTNWDQSKSCTARWDLSLRSIQMQRSRTNMNKNRRILTRNSNENFGGSRALQWQRKSSRTRNGRNSRYCVSRYKNHASIFQLCWSIGLWRKSSRADWSMDERRFIRAHLDLDLG